jgi:dTDP-4-dehydrorhamnose 3,5-epimerase
MVNISKNYADLITVQEYNQKQSINGVKLIDLKLHADDGGEFLELGRLDQGKMKSLPDFEVKQFSWSRLLPGTVKAFHIHRRQADLWYVSPFDRVLVGLADLREESPTYNVKIRLVLGGSQAKLLYIPRGVAHGAGNPWSQPATVVYFTDKEFDPANPDEGRLPYDLFGQDFWTIKKG